MITTGRLLFCADEIKCGEFEDYAYSADARLNGKRQAILEDIRQRGAACMADDVLLNKAAIIVVNANVEQRLDDFIVFIAAIMRIDWQDQ